MSPIVENCPIWGTDATLISEKSWDGKSYYSPRAGGHYKITGTAEAILRQWPTRSAAENVGDRVNLTSQIVQSISSNTTLTITSFNLPQLIKLNLPNLADRAEWLLRKLIRNTEKVGDHLSYPRDPGDDDIRELFAWSSSSEISEVEYLLSYLNENGLIKEFGGASNSHLARIFVTVLGFSLIEKIEVNIASDKAFIAMWFDPSTQDAYEQGIELAVRNAGYNPIRIDKEQHLNKICDEIIANIKRARFIVADFTCGLHETTCIDTITKKNVLRPEPRGGVYFEAGLAQGLGLPVIWTCRQDQIGLAHFDTRQYNHILWKNPDDFQRQLQARIEAVIGDGPLKT